MFVIMKGKPRMERALGNMTVGKCTMDIGLGLEYYTPTLNLEPGFELFER